MQVNYLTAAGNGIKCNSISEVFFIAMNLPTG